MLANRYCYWHWIYKTIIQSFHWNTEKKLRYSINGKGYFIANTDHIANIMRHKKKYFSYKVKSEYFMYTLLMYLFDLYAALSNKGWEWLTIRKQDCDKRTKQEKTIKQFWRELEYPYKTELCQTISLSLSMFRTSLSLSVLWQLIQHLNILMLRCWIRLPSLSHALCHLWKLFLVMFYSIASSTINPSHCVRD